MPLIVVMEDDAATRTLVASVLRKDGYDVLSADNGLSGLELVRQNKPDLVISDVQMPLMDGFAMLQAIATDALPRLIEAFETETDRGLRCWLLELVAINIALILVAIGTMQLAVDFRRRRD